MVRLSLALLLLLIPHAHATPATDLAAQLQQISLDPDACYRIIGLNFAKEDLKIYLNSGYLIFTKPAAGIRSAAVFVASEEGGDAELLLMPPVRSERLSLATFTNSPNLNEHFKEAVAHLLRRHRQRTAETNRSQSQYEEDTRDDPPHQHSLDFHRAQPYR